MRFKTLARKNRLYLTIAVVTALLLVAVLFNGVSAQKSLAESAAPGSAVVVVQFADGHTAVRQVTWTGTISRPLALQAAGFVIESSGDVVCSIEGEECPASDCFCASNLWAQGQWAGTAWDSEAWPPPNVVDGDVIAFRNGTKPDYSDWGLTGFLPAAPTYVAASKALEWMRGQQQSNGGYHDGFDPIGASVRGLLAVGSAGYDPAKWGNPSLFDFLTVVSRTATIQYAAQSASGVGKLTIGAAWAHQTVTDFAGINLPISITSFYNPTTGAYGNGSGDTAWAMLGLHAAGEAIPAQAVAFLKSVQNADGGWAWNEWGKTSETQHTATVVQALLAASEPVGSAEVSKALAFIRSNRNSDGGYGYQSGDASDVDTTAFAVQALLSAAASPGGNWCATVQCDYLLSQQASDGSYLFYGAPSLYTTQEVIPALMHRPYGPLADWQYNCHFVYFPVMALHSGK